jgi:hypothetical protein
MCLMEILHHIGFPLAWRNWISVFLSTASSRVMVNGNPGHKICLGRGLRQGDSLSPMLFLLVEVLNALFQKADEWNLFHRLGVKAINHRESLYADNMVLFLSPVITDLQLFCHIFHLFEEASGLGCNIAKCQMVPIRCDEAQVELATSMFPCQLMEFPLKYLGIPLLVHKLPKAALQSLADRAADKLPAWKGYLMHRSGRLALIKSTPSAIPVYTSIGVGLQPWLIKAPVKIMKAFLWMGTEEVKVGKCAMAWCRMQRPLALGGLWVTDLRLQGMVLKLRWLWLQRQDPGHPWAKLPVEVDPATRAFFQISTCLVVGDGRNSFFWQDMWLDGQCLSALAPDLVRAVPTCLRKRRTLADGLANQAWIRDIKGALTMQVLVQFLEIRQRLQDFALDPDTPDRLEWKWSSPGQFTTRSARSCGGFGLQTSVGSFYG